MIRALTMAQVAIVVAIVAGLTFTFLPRKLQTKDGTNLCIANLNQIGKAVGMYEEAFDGHIPRGVDFADKEFPESWQGSPLQKQLPHLPVYQRLLRPYVKTAEVFHCPSDNGFDFIDSAKPDFLPTHPSAFEVYGTSYLMLSDLAFIRLHAPASRVRLLFDASGLWHGKGEKFTRQPDFSEIAEATKGYRYNVLFADLHAANLSRQEFRRSGRWW
ncbi:MAG: hypothetical protein JSS72_11460 [Armatimonadetes bacterium]|nr:hypothetical protein [Armatimonadota bacterium]